MTCLVSQSNRCLLKRYGAINSIPLFKEVVDVNNGLALAICRPVSPSKIGKNYHV
jgi:hypothetical protein